MGFSYIPDNLESIGIPRGAEIIRNAKVYATAMGLSPQNSLRISSYLDLKDFEKRNEPEPMPEIEVQRRPFMTDIMYRQEYEKQERAAKKRIKSRRIRYENRILKDASAVDLILDYLYACVSGCYAVEKKCHFVTLCQVNGVIFR